MATEANATSVAHSATVKDRGAPALPGPKFVRPLAHFRKEPSRALFGGGAGGTGGCTGGGDDGAGGGGGRGAAVPSHSFCASAAAAATPPAAFVTATVARSPSIAHTRTAIRADVSALLCPKASYVTLPPTPR